MSYLPYANMRFLEGIASIYVTLIVGFSCLILSLICISYYLSSKYYFNNWIPFYRIYYKFNRLDAVIKKIISLLFFILIFAVKDMQVKFVFLILFLIAHYLVLQSWKMKGIFSFIFPLREYIQSFCLKKRKGAAQ